MHCNSAPGGQHFTAAMGTKRALLLPSPSALRVANPDLEREIAERKSAESDIRRLNKQLEERVAKRTAEQDVAHTVARLKDFSRARELEFLPSPGA